VVNRAPQVNRVRREIKVLLGQLEILDSQVIKVSRVLLVRQDLLVPLEVKAN